MVAGNVFTAFNEIAALGDVAEWHGSAMLPAIYFKGLSVAANQG